MYTHIKFHPDAPWSPKVNTNLDSVKNANELVISGIYIRLFNANPGWVLRKPREFLSDLLEHIIQAVGSAAPDLQKLEQVTTAFILLLTTQPNLAEMIPPTGYLSRLFAVMGNLDGNVINAPVLITNEIAK